MKITSLVLFLAVGLALCHDSFAASCGCGGNKPVARPQPEPEPTPSFGRLGGLSEKQLTPEYVTMFKDNVEPLFMQYLAENPTYLPTGPANKMAPVIIAVREQVVAGLNLEWDVKYLGRTHTVRAFRPLQGPWELKSVTLKA